MTVLIALGVIALVLAACAYYFRKAKEYVVDSEPAWDRLYEAAKEVISDPTVPDQAANFATAAVMCAGCGCLTRGILIDELFRRGRSGPGAFSHDLTPEQMSNIARVVLNAVYYDALRAPLSGFILRRLVAPWLRAAAEGLDAPSVRESTAEFAASSRRVIAHRKRGRLLLSAAGA